MNTLRERVAWAAGLFEGEGCVYTPKEGGGSGGLKLNVTSTDREVLETFAQVFGCGNVYGPYGHPNQRAKPLYHFSLTGRRAYAVLVAMWPWLHGRRKAKAEECIRYWLALHQTGGRRPNPLTRAWTKEWA